MANMVINQELFLKWIEHNIVAEYAQEASEASKGHYASAIEHREARSTFEFIKRAVECDPDDDIAEFMEEAE